MPDAVEGAPEVPLAAERPSARSRPAPEPHPQTQAYSTWLQPRARPAPAFAPEQPVSEQPFAEPPVSDRRAAPAAASAPELPQPAELEEEGGSYEDTLNRELEAVLQGLSSPLNPRATMIHRAEAFAPARNEAAEDSETPEPLDEFDQLIASELAAIRPVPAATLAPAANVLPNFDADQDLDEQDLDEEERAYAPEHVAVEAPRPRPSQVPATRRAPRRPAGHPLLRRSLPPRWRPWPPGRTARPDAARFRRRCRGGPGRRSGSTGRAVAAVRLATVRC